MTALRYARIPTVHGPWWHAWSGDGVCAGAPPEWDERRFAAWLRARHDGDVAPGDPAGVPDGIDWRFVPAGFRREVLEACARIPAGEVRSYGELAADAGRPGAARAVGTAMATNPLPPVVPCHRVVRSDGRIGEYGAGGPERKRAMLAAEGVVVRDGVVWR
ncbi:MAG: MGMT family protein [Actinomycetota bacterium]